MQSLLNKLYEELYSPKVTPYELLENVKLPNYKYVNAYKQNGYLLVESCCELTPGEEAFYYYKFDSQDHLLTLTSKISSVENIEYDRDIEINKLKVQLAPFLSSRAITA